MADQTLDYENMSDEDFLNAPPPDLTAAAAAGGESGAGKDDGSDKEGGAADADTEGEASGDAGQGEGGSEEGAGDGQGEGEGTGEGEGSADDAGDQPGGEGKPSPEAKKDDAGKEKKEVEKTADPAPVNFEAEYKRMLAPFKANGREVAVKSVDDAIQLMQMGANYNKRMAALKPNLKIMKLLESNGFLNEDKIGFLIDLGRKDPAAISKLVKESGIDPMDLDAEKASAYKPTARNVSDEELALDTVLDELKDSPTYTRTLEIVGTQWDAASKHVIAKNPEIVRVVNNHINSGHYDIIAAEIESERMLGRLKGLSDIEAYKQIGDAIHERGGFKHLEQPSGTQTPLKQEPVVVDPKSSKAEEDKRNEKRRAASSTKPAAPKAGLPKDFNPLGMSDEEFSKHAEPKFV